MSENVLVIISTREREKAITGMMYATNALKYAWMNEVKVVIFGPSQRLALHDTEFQGYLKELAGTLGSVPFACKYIADEEGFSRELEELGMNVVYVGAVISDYLKQGYVPLVF